MSRSEVSSISRHAGHNFHEVFHLRQGVYSDMPTFKILEMMKSTNLDVRAIWYFFLKCTLDNHVGTDIIFISFHHGTNFAERSYPVTFEFCEWHP